MHVHVGIDVYINDVQELKNIDIFIDALNTCILGLALYKQFPSIT